MSNEKKEERLFWPDLLRGLSALAVSAMHLRYQLFPSYSDIESPGVFSWLFYALTGFGHQAVMVFFVLSGYFVGGAVLRRRDQFHYSNYLVSRLSRLWVVLIPALLLTAAVDHWLVFVAPDAIRQIDQIPYLQVAGSKLAPFSYTWTTWLGNLAFLQNLTVPPLGSNAPLWSLSNEFWYYLIFPLLVVGVLGKSPNLLSRFWQSALLGLLLWFCWALLGGFLVWVMGVMVYALSKNKMLAVPRWIQWLALAVFCLTLLETKLEVLVNGSHFWEDILVGAGGAIFLFALLAGKPLWKVRKKSLAARVVRFSADFSFSLYAIHYPFVILISAWRFNHETLTFTAFSVAEYTLWMAVIVAVATLFWFLFESRTDTVRRMIARYFPRQM